MNKEQKQKIKEWVCALRSGKYNQTFRRLRSEKRHKNGQYGYCCLGVACEINGTLKGVKCKHANSKAMPASIWFENTFGFCVSKELKVDEKIKNRLSRLNDHERLTFNQIADVIEKEFLIQKRDAKGRFIKA